MYTKKDDLKNVADALARLWQEARVAAYWGMPVPTN